MRNIKEQIMKYCFLICACVSVAAVAAICLFIFVNGIPAMGKIGVFKFLLGTEWSPSKGVYGILPMIIGSIYVTAGAAVVGVPIGILTAVFMVYYCPAPIYKIVKPAIDLLAGIPSIVYGFFGLVVIVPVIQDLLGTSGKGVLTASILLGLMILPTIISTAESSLRAAPDMYYEGALALGATKERSIFGAVFPAAKSGILSGVILGIGRAIGETMAVVIVAGNQAVIPKSLTDGVRTLTANIVLEMAYAAELHREALIATAVVLFVFILAINLCFSAIKRKAVKV
ncbi:MAG: phosphate ABC transporter permease subunit PstC [Acutalibacteraceae bacterium]